MSWLEAPDEVVADRVDEIGRVAADHGTLERATDLVDRGRAGVDHGEVGAERDVLRERDWAPSA